MAPRWKTPAFDAPGQVTPAAARFVRGVVGPWVRAMHRPSMEGLEHLPKDRPYLLVANHSAGLAVSEIAAFMAAWVEKVGLDRPIAGFAHPLGFALFPASVLLRQVGAVPSTYDAALETLRRGVPLLVFPGGDHESMRPVWQADRVDFGGRKGFLRIARDANVAIVPMGIHGSHFAAPILWRSRHVLPNALVLPRLVGLKRWALTATGVAGAAALLLGPSWSVATRAVAAMAWLTSPLVFLPVVPSTIRMRVGPAIEPSELFREGDLDAALAWVQRAVQALVETAARPGL
jgi:1-acyl-sn-glycerol-3-phosphate acyltransferase